MNNPQPAPTREPMRRYEEGTYPDKKFTPVGNLVVFVIIKEQHEFLALPDNAVDAVATPRCHVVAVGPEVKWVRPGDTVLIHHHPPYRRVRIGGDDYGVIEEVMDGRPGPMGVVDKAETVLVAAARKLSDATKAALGT